MKNWHWVSSLITILVFIIGFTLGFLFFGTSKVDQYVVFRDTLTLVLSFVAIVVVILGIALYKIISLSLEREVKQIIQDRTQEELVGFYLELSIAYWQQYETDYKEGTVLVTEDRKKFLNMAIQTGRKALEKANRLDERKFEKLICDVKNNFAYHLAARGFVEDSQRTINLAKYAYDRVLNFDYKDTWLWVETYAFVLIGMGDEGQKKEGLVLVRGLMDREDIDNQYKKYMRKKYGQLLS